MHKYILISLLVLLTGCTSVEQVIAHKETYCGSFYKSVRAVGRSAISLSSGIVVPDVCDTIDEIVEAEESEE